MAIELRPSGEAQAVAKAGQVIGAGERAKEERAGAEREAARQQQLKAQQMAQEWEMQKMLYRSQQDFLHEQRITALDQEKFERAKKWDIDKMELASKIDFEQEEKQRQKEYEEFLNTRDYIKQKAQTGIDEKEIENMNFMNAYNHKDLDKPEITEALGRSQEYINRLQGVKPTIEKPESVTEQQWNLLNPDEQRDRALIAAGIKPRAARPETEFDKLKQLDELTKITSSFEENADVNPGFGKTIVPLAVRDNKGNLIEATPEESLLYFNSKASINRLTAEQTSAEGYSVPTTEEEFKSKVSQLKALDAIKAQAYYNLYKSKFGYE